LKDYIVQLEQCDRRQLANLGEKSVTLGEMLTQLSSSGIRIPPGFATTATAWKDFMAQNGLQETLNALLADLDVNDVESTSRLGAEARRAILDTPLLAEFRDAVTTAWQALQGGEETALSIRSSIASSKEYPDTSFAGQQETLLNVTDLQGLLSGIHEVFASLFSDRAISHRVHSAIAHDEVAMCVIVQRLVRSDTSSAGVMFTLDTESGFRDLVLITSTYGLGESIVQGLVNPDEFYVFKPTLRANCDAIVRRNLGVKADKLICGGRERVKLVDVEPDERMRFSLASPEILELARQAVAIEELFEHPMGIEWARDGLDGELYILHVSPETVQSRSAQGTVNLRFKQKGRVLTSGRSIGQRVGGGRARVIKHPRDMHLLRSGEVLVTDMTDPDWEPVMKRAAAIVTDRGGRTSHAAIFARELGIAAVVGCEDASTVVPDGKAVTVSCAEGDEGFVYEGKLDYELQEFRIGLLPEIPVKLMMNVSNPDRAFSLAATPNFGVGLVRLESIINRLIGVHPLALIEYERQPLEIREQIDDQMAGYDGPTDFFVNKLAEGIACIAAAVSPNPAIVRLSDLKSHEYAGLIGGRRFEPTEENPMLGFRGAARYADREFRRCFELECRALRRVRLEMGLTNVEILVPFVRSLKEAERVVELMRQNGLQRGEDDLKIHMMCETPGNALQADEYLAFFDGMSIGSNDMTQLTLGVDRDSARVAELFDEQSPAVQQLFSLTIDACRHQGKYVGICGEGPSDFMDLALWLAEQGIEAISLNPDVVIPTWLHLAENAKTPDLLTIR
jgi:pyruvate,water dikinase